MTTAYDPARDGHPDPYYRLTPDPAGCQDPLACGLCDWFCPICQAVEDAYRRDLAAWERIRRERAETEGLARQMAVAMRHHPDVLRDPLAEAIAGPVAEMVSALLEAPRG